MNIMPMQITYSMRAILTLLILSSASVLTNAQDGDVRGGKDHPLLTRVPGSTIIKYDKKSFDEVVMPLGSYQFFAESFKKTERVEGAVYRIGYRLPDGRSTLEVLHSYRKELSSEEGEILFECSGESECGNGFDNGFNDLPGEEALFSAETIDEESQRYLAARLTKAAGDIYVVVYTYYQYSTERPFIRLRVIETEAEQEQLVTLNAEALKRSLDQSGHVAVKGIYFDTDKATLRPESEPVLREMASLLNSDTSLKVYIVGHTDDTGSLEHNMKLSGWRAKAVADYLIGRLGVNRTQIIAHGVGPLAPVATNDTAKGRQQNRRVELVKRLQ